ncbi:MAG TPA: TolC family protein [Armatimonadota bacterium]|nr:TolC family protein [Armatimonadota bacterium]
MPRPRHTASIVSFVFACLVMGVPISAVSTAPAASEPDAAPVTSAAFPVDPGSVVAMPQTPVHAASWHLMAPKPNEAVPTNSDTIRTPGPSATQKSLATPVPSITSVPVPQPALSPLTIEKSITIALQHNPALQMALNNIEKARGGVDEARARLNPTVTAQLSMTGQGSDAEATPTGQGVSVFPQAGASIAWPVDFFHQLRYALDISKYQYQSQYLSMVSTMEQLVLTVKTAYFDLLRACGQLTVAQTAVDDAQAQLKQTKDKYDAGTIASFDVTSAEVNVANLQQQLLVAQNQVRLAQTAFNRVLGIDVNTPTQIVGVDISVDAGNKDIPELIHEAYARRPEIQTAQLGITQAKTTVSLQKSSLYPTVSIGAGPTYYFNQDEFNEHFSWQVGVSVSVPLTDGGVTHARVRQARADVQTSYDSVEQTQLTVAEDVRTAALNLDEATQRTQTTARAVSLAEEAVSLAKLRYGAGLAVLVEVTNAETQLTQARNNAVNALYDYAVASAQLQRATSTQPELAVLQSSANSTTHQR